MTLPKFVLAILTTLLLAAAADARPGPGGGTGPGKGVRDRCGSTLTVVLPDGTERVFTPAEDFLKDMPKRDFNQGEETRIAAALPDVLKAMGATWVTVQDCADRSQDMPAGLPVEGEIYVVVTGRGSLKFAKEVRPGVFSNVIQNVKRLRFHAPAERREPERSKGQR